MTQALAKQDESLVFGFEREQVDLIKATIAKGVTDDELKLFLITAQRLSLDPFAKQIYAVKRWDSKLGREVMAIQVGIDGLRAVADRTGTYAPGGYSYEYETDKSGRKFLVKVTATVKKLVSGTWHEIPRDAHWDEYVQTTKDGSPTAMWRDKPHVMLGKCAEAQALRAAFPQLGGSYVPEEMQHGQPEVQEVSYTEEKKGLDVAKLDGIVERLPPDLKRASSYPDSWKPPAPPPVRATPTEGAKEVHFPMGNESPAPDEITAMREAEYEKKKANWNELHKLANEAYPGDAGKDMRKVFYLKAGLNEGTRNEYVQLTLAEQQKVLNEAKGFYAQLMSDIDWGEKKPMTPEEIEAAKEAERNNR